MRSIFQLCAAMLMTVLSSCCLASDPDTTALLSIKYDTDLSVLVFSGRQREGVQVSVVINGEPVYSGNGEGLQFGHKTHGFTTSVEVLIDEDGVERKYTYTINPKSVPETKEGITTLIRHE